LQFAQPASHTVPQVPLLQVAVVWGGFGQTMPQPLQFNGSLFGFTQTPLQLICGETQLVTHAPPEQICPLGQLMPQPPQLFGSLLVFTHTEPHWE
jgi:hypothetical protein